MGTTVYHNPLTDVLFEQASEFVGLYHVEQAWFTHVNTAGYRLLGYPSAQALYDDPNRTLRTKHLTASEWAKLRERVLRDGRHAVEMELRRQSGEAFWAQVELTHLQIEDVDYFLVRLVNNNRVHQAEHQLAQSVSRFEAVVNHATIGIIMCSRAGSIVLANDKARQLFGYAGNTLLGQCMEALVPDAMSGYPKRQHAPHSTGPQAQGSRHSRDLLGHRRDGSVFPVEISLSYFKLDEERFTVAYVIDATFKKNAEHELLAHNQRVACLNADLEQKVADRTRALETTLQQLEQRTQELSQALAAEHELGELRSRIIAMASHEFRTPLTAVLTSATLVGKYAAAEQQEKRLRHLDHIRLSVKHLTDILDEFLAVGNVEEGHLEAHPSHVELPALLQEALTDADGLRKPGQRIAQEFGPLEPLWLDASLLRKVLVNLLSNAFKYSPEHTTVTVRAATENRWLTLSVQDHGIGIPPEDQEHLLEQFFRARNATNFPGTGLGLYIIARYLELLGGTVALHSTLHMGTTVTITVPNGHHSAN